MKRKDIEAAYAEYVVAHDLERSELLQDLAGHLGQASVLYPGCFLHLTPAFFFPRVTFIDQNERAAALFAEPGEVAAFVNDHKRYRQAPGLRFVQQDYTRPLPLGRERFGLLLVLHAPGALAAGRPWLAPGGLLLVNETYGQAAEAARDKGLECLGVYAPTRKGHRFQAAKSDCPQPGQGPGSQPSKGEHIWLFQSRGERA